MSRVRGFDNSVLDLRLQLRFFYRSGFIVLFRYYFSVKHTCYRDTVELGTLGVGRTIFRAEFRNFVFVLVWEHSPVILSSLNSMAACIAEESRMFAFVSRAQPSDRQVSWLVSYLGFGAQSTTRNGSFKTKTDNGYETCRMSTFPYFNHNESWAAVLTSDLAILLTLRSRLACTSREKVGLRHYRYHPRTNPLYFFVLMLGLWKTKRNMAVPARIWFTWFHRRPWFRSHFCVGCNIDLHPNIAFDLLGYLGDRTNFFFFF